VNSPYTGTPLRNEIDAFLHCPACLKQVRADVELHDESPRSYARLEIGLTKTGLQIWCTRHELNVAHFEIPRAYFRRVKPTCACGASTCAGGD